MLHITHFGDWRTMWVCCRSHTNPPDTLSSEISRCSLHYSKGRQICLHPSHNSFEPHWRHMIPHHSDEVGHVWRQRGPVTSCAASLRFDRYDENMFTFVVNFLPTGGWLSSSWLLNPVTALTRWGHWSTCDCASAGNKTDDVKGS